jgi:hypothetical protein
MELRMAREVPDIRPAVISAGVAAKLDESGHFRHLVRSLCATNLVPDKLQGLVLDPATMLPALRAEPIAFAAFLEQISPDGR